MPLNIIFIALVLLFGIFGIGKRFCKGLADLYRVLWFPLSLYIGFLLTGLIFAELALDGYLDGFLIGLVGAGVIGEVLFWIIFAVAVCLMAVIAAIVIKIEIWLLSNISEAAYPVKQLRYLGRFFGFFVGTFKGVLLTFLAIFLLAGISPILAGDGGDKAAFFNKLYEGSVMQANALEDPDFYASIDDFFETLFEGYRPFCT
ncbi:MAG: hypothetical protein FWE62_01740 [Firmicutes bacterium]|nr:hypothetical protein [Bacillota bacterium]